MDGANDDDESPFSALSFRQIAWRLSAHSFIYTAGAIAVRFGGLLLIPLYWRYLDPADYGILAAAAVVTNFLAVVLGLGISESITRFYHAWPAEERRPRVGSLWIADWVSSLAIGIPLAFWGGSLVQIAAKQVPFTPYLQLAVVSATLWSFATAPITLLRVQEKSATYVGISVASFGVRTAVAIYLVVFQHRGPLGVLQADVAAGLLMLPVYAIVMASNARLAVHTPVLSEGIRYSLPLLPGVFAESLMWMMDRFVLEKYVTLTVLGLYALGDSIGSVVRVVNAGFKTAWLPFVMRAAIERIDAAKVIARAATFYVLATLVVGLGVAMMSADLIALIGVPKYFPVATIVPFFVVPNVLLCLLPVGLSGLGVAKRTGLASATAAAQLVVGVGAMVVLVPHAGVYGALLAIALGTTTRLVLGFTLAQRFYPVAFEWRKIGMLTAIAVGTFALGRAVPVGPSFAGLAIRLTILLGYTAGSAWFTLGGHRVWMNRRPRTGVA
jgi:O-antigen/teichoic acid export membrane protein